jgi:hypothetical protein
LSNGAAPLAGAGGGVGDGGSINATAAWASSVRMSYLFLHITDYGVEFLPELDGLSSLAVVVGGHRRSRRGTPRGGAVHRRCNGRREGGMSLGFERSGSEKNLGSDYHVGERHAVEYWMYCIECIDTYL